jgi:hypothetical protein
MCITMFSIVEVLDEFKTGFCTNVENSKLTEIAFEFVHSIHFMISVRAALILALFAAASAARHPFECACPESWDPVCAFDGFTYINEWCIECINNHPDFLGPSKYFEQYSDKRYTNGLNIRRHRSAFPRILRRGLRMHHARLL